jgi:hypothetical protein
MLQSVIASAARQSVEHIAGQTRKSGIFAAIPNAKYCANHHSAIIAISNKKSKVSYLWRFKKPFPSERI